MLVVGLTGGIATGKSTVSNSFKARNIPVIDADILAREVVQPGTPGLSQIVKHFGSSVLLPDGTLDRKQLGSIIFNDEAKRKKVNSIIHPAVTRAILWGVLKYWVRGHRLVVIDVPLLIEGGLWKWMGKVVVVYCPPEIQLQRLMHRDQSTREDASARLNSQLPISQKVEYADLIVENSGTMGDLEEQVKTCISKLEKAAGWSWWLSWFPPIGVLSAFWVLGWRALGRTRSRKPSTGKRS